MGNDCIDLDYFDEINRVMDVNKSSSSIQNDKNEVMYKSGLTVELLPAIFKLNVDCFHEVFDCLPLQDVISVGKTCKRLQRIAGHFINLNYASKSARGENDGIYISSLKSNIFSQFIQKLSISGDRLCAYHFAGENCRDTIKHLRVYGTLPLNGFTYIKEILKGVEMLEMNECFFNGDFYENYLKYCPNVKSLNISRSGRIRDSKIVIGNSNEWMLRTYPTLQHLELIEIYELKMFELREFFNLNPNLQTFSTDSRGLWENRYSILESTVKLETLAIDIYQLKLDYVYELLVVLFNQKFYKKLNLYMVFIDQQNIHKLYSLRGVEMINGDITQVDKPLLDLRAFAVWCGDELLNIEDVPNFIPNAERVYFSRVMTNKISSFIRLLPKLKHLRIRYLKDIDQFKKLDLEMLNKERENLLSACKVNIYVKEDIYLAAKWAMNITDFKLVALKRFESTEWEELSSRAKYFKSF